MKTNRIVLAITSVGGTIAALFLCAATCFPHVAHAETESGLGTWEGTGMVTGAGNREVGPFDVVVTRTAVRPGVVRSDGKIHTAAGRDIVFWQEKTDVGGGAFTLASDRGAGGGCCFANGMCQSLEHREGAHAFASTFAMDGPGRVRLLVTELENGRAIRFYAQTLVKKK